MVSELLAFRFHLLMLAVSLEFNNSTESQAKRNHVLYVSANLLKFPIARYCLALTCLASWYIMLYIWTRNSGRKQRLLQSAWINIIGMIRIVLGAFEGIFWLFRMSGINQARWIMSFNRWNPHADQIRWYLLDLRTTTVIASVAGIAGGALLLIGIISDPAGNGNLAGWVGTSMIIEIVIRVCASIGWNALNDTESIKSSRTFKWIRGHF